MFCLPLAVKIPAFYAMPKGFGRPWPEVHFDDVLLEGGYDAPVQVVEGLFLDDAALTKKNSSLYDDLDDFSEDGFNDDELDGLSINDNYFDEQ